MASVGPYGLGAFSEAPRNWASFDPIGLTLSSGAHLSPPSRIAASQLRRFLDLPDFTVDRQSIASEPRIDWCARFRGTVDNSPFWSRRGFWLVSESRHKSDPPEEHGRCTAAQAAGAAGGAALFGPGGRFALLDGRLRGDAGILLPAERMPSHTRC
ncbi:hypothetical protein ACFPTO_10610 [Paraburkholderia denitrificans]|uniref:Uncharacterized protein n=1 Tax=Paraburkholderia denitrificans TaxID=694025 RepID=A0ABW0J8E6_9BURK